MPCDDLPAHLGRTTDVETGYALLCNATPGGDPHDGALCHRPARHHLRWEESSTENSFACDEHLEYALGLNPFDRHRVENSACGIPGAWWVPEPSHCTMLALEEEPDLARAVAMGSTAKVLIAGAIGWFIYAVAVVGVWRLW